MSFQPATVRVLEYCDFRALFEYGSSQIANRTLRSLKMGLEHIDQTLNRVGAILQLSAFLVI